MANLIFIISLPRSGSTLLQHMLGSHSQIAASAEPWVLFPSLLALRENSFYSKYQPDIGRIALTDFLDQTDDNEMTYFHGVRRYADYMYDAFLKGTGKTFFLDKTSRYYMALPELYKVYPEAKYIFLLRNPVSVLASFIENMVDGNLASLGSDGVRDDLMYGYEILTTQKSNKNIKSYFVQYESLVEDPAGMLEKICEFIELRFERNMIDYGRQTGVLKGKLVDPKSIHRHQSPVKTYLQTWQVVINTEERRRFAYDYLRYLDEDIVSAAGYDYLDLLGRCLPNRTEGYSAFNEIMSGNKRTRGVGGVFKALKKGEYITALSRTAKILFRIN